MLVGGRAGARGRGGGAETPTDRAHRGTPGGATVDGAVRTLPGPAPTPTSQTMIELAEVREGGMSGGNGQRKLGTTRGSPRRCRTAKAPLINRRAAKLRCACEWDGWGRLSDDGSGHDNPNPSEAPLGGGVIIITL